MLGVTLRDVKRRGFLTKRPHQLMALNIGKPAQRGFAWINEVFLTSCSRITSKGGLYLPPELWTYIMEYVAAAGWDEDMSAHGLWIPVQASIMRRTKRITVLRCVRVQLVGDFECGELTEQWELDEVTSWMSNPEETLTLEGFNYPTGNRNPALSDDDFEEEDKSKPAKDVDSDEKPFDVPERKMSIKKLKGPQNVFYVTISDENDSRRPSLNWSNRLFFDLDVQDVIARFEDGYCYWCRNSCAPRHLMCCCGWDNEAIDNRDTWGLYVGADCRHIACPICVGPWYAQCHNDSLPSSILDYDIDSEWPEEVAERMRDLGYLSEEEDDDEEEEDSFSYSDDQSEEDEKAGRDEKDGKDDKSGNDKKDGKDGKKSRLITHLMNFVELSAYEQASLGTSADYQYDRLHGLL